MITALQFHMKKSLRKKIKWASRISNRILKLRDRKNLWKSVPIFEKRLKHSWRSSVWCARTKQKAKRVLIKDAGNSSRSTDDASQIPIDRLHWLLRRRKDQQREESSGMKAGSRVSPAVFVQVIAKSFQSPQTE